MFPKKKHRRRRKLTLYKTARCGCPRPLRPWAAEHTPRSSPCFSRSGTPYRGACIDFDSFKIDWKLRRKYRVEFFCQPHTRDVGFSVTEFCFRQSSRRVDSEPQRCDKTVFVVLSWIVQWWNVWFRLVWIVLARESGSGVRNRTSTWHFRRWGLCTIIHKNYSPLLHI